MNDDIRHRRVTFFSGSRINTMGSASSCLPRSAWQMRTPVEPSEGRVHHRQVTPRFGKPRNGFRAAGEPPQRGIPSFAVAAQRRAVGFLSFHHEYRGVRHSPSMPGRVMLVWIQVRAAPAENTPPSAEEPPSAGSRTRKTPGCRAERRFAGQKFRRAFVRSTRGRLAVLADERMPLLAQLLKGKLGQAFFRDRRVNYAQILTNRALPVLNSQRKVKFGRNVSA